MDLGLGLVGCGLGLVGCGLVGCGLGLVGCGSTLRAREVNWYPFQGKVWLYRSIKGRDERPEGDGSDVLICAFSK